MCLGRAIQSRPGIQDRVQIFPSRGRLFNRDKTAIPKLHGQFKTVVV